MDKEIKTWLYDIQSAVKEIDGFFAGKEKIFNEYKSDIKTKRAVERNLEIKGEAVSRIMKQKENFPLSNYKKIISARNFIIHSYEKISDETIWSIVMNHLPQLKSEVDSLLKEI
jgi:uncharacterized protein with HEPN domain